jgi:competence protein ComEC
VPVALAGTLGLCADRYSSPAEYLWYLLATLPVIALVAWHRKSAAPFLWYAWFAITAGHHHVYRDVSRADDIGRAATETPTLVRVRGLIDDEPTVLRLDRSDPFIPTRKPDHGMTVLAVNRVRLESGDWVPASGKARLIVDRAIEPDGRYALDDIHVGDEVEVTAMLTLPGGRANPGERDFAASERDKRITAELRITKATEAVTRIDRRSDWDGEALLTAARGKAARTLEALMPPRDAAVARALLLGDGAAMDRSEWDEYIRTGVVHVLAISGQHLVVLAGFFWFLFRVAGVRRRYGALAVILVVFAYALLTGLRPSSVRAVIMVGAGCGGLVLRRPVNPANSFALAWIAVIVLDPTDVFSLGCQLSFLAVFVLIWALGRWMKATPPLALDRLIDESRPAWVRSVRSLAKAVGLLYLVTVVLFVATGPILLDRQNVLSPVGILIGPPLIFLTGVALVTGFVTLMIGSVSLTLAVPFAWVTKLCLALCGVAVTAADHFPGGAVYSPAPPVWWQIGFYLVLVAAILLGRPWPRRLGPGLAGWIVLGVFATGPKSEPDELRVTFLSVGHGTAAVIESPDGRVLLYDLGTMAGPDVVRRTVAPYLWYRGVGRIDEVFLSHADTDHFNGLPELLRRFPVGTVTLTPSFATKPTPEVAAVLTALAAKGIDPRIAVAGDRFDSGPVRIDVLHPPPAGPGTTENERSLVLVVSFAGRSVLLTGDLEKAGTATVVQRPPVTADVVMAPHHGSRPAFGRDFREWAKTKFVVVSKGHRDVSAISENDLPNATVWDTPRLGAVTVRIHKTGVVAEAFRTGERVVLRR